MTTLPAKVPSRNEAGANDVAEFGRNKKHASWKWLTPDPKLKLSGGQPGGALGDLGPALGLA